MATSTPLDVASAAGPARWLVKLAAFTLPLAIVALGVLLIVLHRRAWRAAVAAGDTGELAFQRRRYRRRLQTSGLLVVLGVAMEGGQWIPAQNHPSLFVFFWFAVAMLALWLLGLALCDVVATRLHLQQQLREQLIERARLQAELTRVKAEEQQASPRNGK
ncbi:MAG TPA: hypothetical protein VFI31_26390 [Pirellulales bacterium]|nr:hypothetical protein [Pirellulales bacterium]